LKCIIYNSLLQLQITCTCITIWLQGVKKLMIVWQYLFFSPNHLKSILQLFFLCSSHLLLCHWSSVTKNSWSYFVLFLTKLSNTKHNHRKIFSSHSVTKWQNTQRNCWTEEEVQMISHDQHFLLQKSGGDLTLKPSDCTKYGPKNIITYCHCATFWRVRCFSVVC
jgi:hypothetical protein